jgi:carboxyl-terminal processing protease
MQVGKKGYVFEPKSFKIINQDKAPQVVDYQLLWDAINTVNEKYVENKPTPLQFLYGAVKGAVESTGDPYTTFFQPSDLESFKTDLKGSFEGIGAEIGKQGDSIVIVAPLDGTPAKQAGLLPKDIITKVNGESTAGWSVEEAVSKIRGKKGTSVVLTILRESKPQPFDVKITRDNIVVKSVKLEFKQVTAGNGEKKDVAIITISKFGDDTDSLFNSAVNEILNHSVAGIVVDLRNNPGGYLQTSVDLASAWVNEGDVVVTEEKSQGPPNIYRASGRARLGNIKTLVLINGGSASASEILAGALHDHQKASLLGEKSFGKGSVQELVDLRDNTAIKITVAKWVTPNGKNLNKEGLNPDVEVKMTGDDISAGKDPQMDAALQEIIK